MPYLLHFCALGVVGFAVMLDEQVTINKEFLVLGVCILADLLHRRCSCRFRMLRVWSVIVYIFFLHAYDYYLKIPRMRNRHANRNPSNYRNQ